jgi:hypothetical protein
MVRRTHHSPRGASAGVALVALLGVSLFITGAYFTFSGVPKNGLGPEGMLPSENSPTTSPESETGPIAFPVEQVLCEIDAFDAEPSPQALRRFLEEAALRIDQLGEREISFTVVPTKDAAGALLFSDSNGSRWILHWRLQRSQRQAAIVFRVVERLGPIVRTSMPDLDEVNTHIDSAIDSIRLPLEDAARELDLDIHFPRR